MKLGWIGLVGVALVLAVACFPKESEETSETEMSWNASGGVGAVAAGDSRAVAAGIEILREGGNAADAAAAVILALSVTDYGQYCIGGEVPFLIYDVRREAVEVLSGQGAAPKLATLEHYRKIGGIPQGGDPNNLQSAAVPAVIDLCVTALERYGTRTFAQVARPVLEILDAGQESWHPKLAGTLRRLIEAETQAARRIRPLLPGRHCRGAGRLVPEAWRTAAQGGSGRPQDLGGEAGHHRLSGLYRLQGRALDPGALSFPSAAIAGGARPPANGTSFRRLHPRGRRGHEAGPGRP